MTLYKPWKDLFDDCAAKFFKDERQSTIKIDEEIRQDAWRRGFQIKGYCLYNVKEHGYDHMLSDFQRDMTRNINGRHSIILDDKLVLYKSLSGIVAQPEVIAGTFNRNDRLICEKWKTLLRADHITSVFVKPTRAGLGIGIFKAEIGGNKIRIGATEIGEKQFFDSLQSSSWDYIVTIAVQQHAAFSAYYPHTTNTLRVISLQMPGSKARLIPLATLRVGTKASGVTDNFSSGGVIFDVDPETGKIGSGLQQKPDGSVQWMTSHPDTAVEISGQTIPHWREICKALHTAFIHLPFLKYIGWDVALSTDGPVIIEGNSYTGIRALQAFRPLLRDRDLRKFYGDHGILRFTTPYSFPEIA